MKKRCLIEPHYFPGISYMSLLTCLDELILEVEESFGKQSYRNRCYVLAANKVLRLTVPVKHGHGKKLKTREVKIDNDENWVDLHWRSIQSSYGKSPFFEFCKEDIYNILHAGHTFLIDLNYEILTYCLDLCKVELKISFSQDYNAQPSKGILDFRNHIHPKLKDKKDQWFNPQPYTQVFGKNFVPDLSILDLIFCEGPQAGYILQKSVFKSLVERS